MRHKNSSVKLNQYNNIIINLEKKQTTKRIRKSKAAEREASRNGWSQSITLSPSLSHSLSLSHLSVQSLSVSLSVCLPVCLPVQVDLSYRGRKRKGVSPRMAVGTKGSAIRTHQQQTDRERRKERKNDSKTDGTEEKEERKTWVSCLDLIWTQAVCLI